MGIRTFLLFLIGDRRAILDLAADRRTVAVGLLLVLSAGFAREYDGEDLLREPWYLALPLAASLASSFVLFLFCVGRRFIVDTVEEPNQLGLASGYRSFLGLFWMTAPMAWLYAIPYERFLDPVAAMQANLTTLAVVAAWRVLLMMRVVSTLTGRRGISLHAFFRVLAFADLVVVAAIYFLPIPLIDVMGGIRYSPSERALRDTAMSVSAIGWVSLPIWLIGALAVRTPPRHQWAWHAPRRNGERPAWPDLFALAVASVLLWAAVLPFTQPQQQRRKEVERLFAERRDDEALALLAEHWPHGFPPAWDPPPYERDAFEYFQRLVDILQRTTEQPSAAVLRTLYAEKMRDILAQQREYSHFWSELQSMEPVRQSLVNVLPKLPEGPALARLLCLKAPSHLHPFLGRIVELAKVGATDEQWEEIQRRLSP